MLVLASIALFFAASNPCQVHGRIQIVPCSAISDYKVRVVTPNTDAVPDLRVQKVDWIANREGYWRIVEHSPDFTIKVDCGSADFTIQYVSYLPGCGPGC